MDFIAHQSVLKSGFLISLISVFTFSILIDFRHNYERLFEGAVYALGGVVAIIYFLSGRHTKKMSSVELATEYRNYKENQSARKSVWRILWGIIILLFSIAAFSNPDTQAFKDYYMYHNPDAQILAIYRESFIIRSDYRVKLRTGEEETYTGRHGGNFEKIVSK
ncbi:hypothetical protein DCC62_14590 [candidate division KSB1 bacterium]|nr:MAG: hypothetical protein DCC62_14590 [candidate division KSB1 bacterium]